MQSHFVVIAGEAFRVLIRLYRVLEPREGLDDVKNEYTHLHMGVHVRGCVGVYGNACAYISLAYIAM